MPTSCPKVCFFLLFNFCREWSICLLYIHFCQPNRVPLAVKHFNTFVNLLYHPVPCKVNKIVAVWLAPSTLLLLCCLTEKIEIFSILLSVAKENRNRYDLSYTLWLSTMQSTNNPHTKLNTCTKVCFFGSLQSIFMLHHCRHVGGQKQYIFSPLGNKIYFHAKLFHCFSPPTWLTWKPFIVWLIDARQWSLYETACILWAF